MTDTGTEQVKQRESTPAISCPHCNEPLGLNIVNRLTAQSRVKFAISPKDGQLLSAKTVGGTLEQMEKLLVSMGKDMGVRTSVSVESVECDKGAVTFNLLIGRLEKGVSNPSNER